jgi:hypothetical protein
MLSGLMLSGLKCKTPMICSADDSLDIEIYECAINGSIGHSNLSFGLRLQNILGSRSDHAMVFLLYDFADQGLRANIEATGLISTLDQMASNTTSLFRMHSGRFGSSPGRQLLVISKCHPADETASPVCALFWRWVSPRVQNVAVAKISDIADGMAELKDAINRYKVGRLPQPRSPRILHWSPSDVEFPSLQALRAALTFAAAN